MTKSAIALFAGRVRRWLAQENAHRLGYVSRLILAAIGLYILGNAASIIR